MKATAADGTGLPGGVRALVLFDGHCNLCTASVQFIIARDKGCRFHFASLQGSWAARNLPPQWRLRSDQDPASVLLFQDGRFHSHSAAALEIARQLDGCWPLFDLCWLWPAFVRDAIYRWVARHRYRWFGRQASCWLPTPELRARFLD
ncbi:MAG: DUF393 domain-containing protein [Leptospiraceae bacterium]|nr:DUF393 domain-containing protein [Leptospiraceae bacterium]